MEITMTDQLCCVTCTKCCVVILTKKPRAVNVKMACVFMQYRWRCTFRHAYYVCMVLFPYAHTKLDKITKIIEHYKGTKIMNGKVVDLNEYKKLMSLEV